MIKSRKPRKGMDKFMEIKKIMLSEDYPDAYLEAYISFNNDKNADAILICPGGGYNDLAKGHEGEGIAITFAARGYRTFVLTYSVKEKAKFPTPLIEASLAMSHIKRNAEEYGVNPARVFVIGFSAGGHLAGSLGTLWHKDWLNEKLSMPFGENRPKGMILSYPVLAYFPETHLGTFARAVGTEHLTEENTAELSLDKQVDGEHTVPAFLWHTMDDPVVHVENTLKMLSALRRHGVHAEAHLFPHGRHGVGTANSTVYGDDAKKLDPRLQDWVNMADGFMKSLV